MTAFTCGYKVVYPQKIDGHGWGLVLDTICRHKSGPPWNQKKNRCLWNFTFTWEDPQIEYGLQIPTPVDAGVMEDDVYEPLKKTRSDRRGWGVGKPRGCSVHVYTILEKINNTLGKYNTSWKPKLRNPTGSSLKALFLLIHVITASTCYFFGGHLYHQFLAIPKKCWWPTANPHDLIHDLIRHKILVEIFSPASKGVVKFAEKLQLLVTLW